MGFYKLFGMNALPFRAFVFLTQFANLILICAIVRRLTRSDLAGFLAPVLWMVNSSLSVAISWNSAYNQIQMRLLDAARFLSVRALHTNGRKALLLVATGGLRAGLWCAGDQRCLSRARCTLLRVLRAPVFRAHISALRRLRRLHRSASLRSAAADRGRLSDVLRRQPALNVLHLLQMGNRH
jgi:hypothetical protein